MSWNTWLRYKMKAILEFSVRAHYPRLLLGIGVIVVGMSSRSAHTTPNLHPNLDLHPNPNLHPNPKLHLHLQRQLHLHLPLPLLLHPHPYIYRHPNRYPNQVSADLMDMQTQWFVYVDDDTYVRHGPLEA